MIKKSVFAGKAFPVTLLFLCAVFFAAKLSARQDTLRVMHYNLLNYGTVTSAAYKNTRLSAIIQYIQPSVLEVNELGNNVAYAQSILDNVLGANWQRGSYINTNNEQQANMIFWRSDKLAMVSQTVISHQLRDIIAYRFYYRDADLAQTKDTIFFTMITAHLKAGSYAADSIDRAAETATVASFLNGAQPGNYIMCGDFNLYTSAEKAYQNLVSNTNMAARLYDPLSSPGEWHSNASFAGIHTQSTRIATLSDGGATGGLDDRFDFVLMSPGIINNTYKMRYLPGSYKATGQDGNHLNKALIANPVNAAVPAAVLQALYEMSDHLPVQADIVLSPKTGTAGITPVAFNNDIKTENPFSGRINIWPGSSLLHEPLTITVYDLKGNLLMSSPLLAEQTDTPYSFSVPGTMPGGVYVLRITGRQVSFSSLIHHL